jgi:hypothetical protein
MNFKIKKILFLIFLLTLKNFSFAVDVNDVKHVNANLILYFEKLPMPEQEVLFFKPNNLDINNINWDPQPINMMQGSRWKIRVELIDENQKKKDITSNKNLKFTTTSYRVHICGNVELCIWPENEEASKNYDLRFGKALVRVDYSVKNKIFGFNGIQVNVLPNPNIKPPPPPAP